MKEIMIPVVSRTIDFDEKRVIDISVDSQFSKSIVLAAFEMAKIRTAMLRISHGKIPRKMKKQFKKQGIWC